MAKKAGSEEKAASMETGKGPAQPGHNAAPEIFLSAVKNITAQKAVVNAANEKLKAMRKDYKARGIELGILDKIVAMAEWSRGEIRTFFATQAMYAKHLGLPTGADVDLFSKTPESVIQQIEWEAAGRTAALTGKPARWPDECPEDCQQLWMKGFRDADEEMWDDAGSESAEVVEPKKPAKGKGKAKDGEKTAPLVEASEEQDPDGEGDSLEDALIENGKGFVDAMGENGDGDPDDYGDDPDREDVMQPSDEPANDGEDHPTTGGEVVSMETGATLN